MTVEELLKKLEGVPPESQVMVLTEDVTIHSIKDALPEREDEADGATTVWLKVEEF